MNDDDLSELILRASAYLDGELDADETARAEADPAVMAEVEQLRALQDEVRAVEPPTESTRESAIGAALAEFDRSRTAAPSAVVPLRRRPSYARWLTAAAAVVAIGVLGVVVAQSGGDDDDSAGSADEFTVTAALEAATASPAEQDAGTALDDAPMAAADAGDDVGGATATAEESAELPADSPDTTREAADPTETGGEASATTTAAGGGTAAPVTVSATTEPSVIPTTAPRTFDGPITSENLFEIGQQLLADYRAGTLTVPATHCEFGGYVVLARAPFLVSDTEREAVIAADPDSGETGAFDADSCEPFDIVTPPAP